MEVLEEGVMVSRIVIETVVAVGLVFCVVV